MIRDIRKSLFAKTFYLISRPQTEGACWFMYRCTNMQSKMEYTDSGITNYQIIQECFKMKMFQLQDLRRWKNPVIWLKNQVCHVNALQSKFLFIFTQVTFLFVCFAFCFLLLLYFALYFNYQKNRTCYIAF